LIFYSEVMNLNIKDSVGFLSFKALENFRFFKHAFSTRIGGVSTGNFKTLNLGKKNSDEKCHVDENYRRFFDSVEIKMDTLTFLDHVHGENIKVVSQKNFKNIEKFDGSITNTAGITLVTFHADCCPIFILDPVKKLIGLAHAGWRGTVKDIAGKMVSKMIYEFKVKPKNLICCIGPAIRNCCFEVKQDVANEFKIKKDSENFIKILNNKIFVDLLQCNKQSLIESGVSENKIIISDICTSCFSDLIFSHRAHGKSHGTAIAIATLKANSY